MNRKRLAGPPPLGFPCLILHIKLRHHTQTNDPAFTGGNISDLDTFRDAESSFTIMVPKDWERVPSESPGTRVSFVSRQPDGSMKAGFNVRVDQYPSLGDLPPAEQAGHLKEYVENGVEDVRSSIDAPVKVLQSGAIEFSGRPGYYAIYELSTGSPGDALRVLQFAVYGAGNTYAVTFSCKADNYDSQLPVIKQIASTFTILPSPDQPAR
ncbi:MAG: hypothetical protein IPM25_12915 [Chloracidobacterium sp.]|nr:hypothetical protein [Chloracidobacterium sp.]